MTIRQQIQATIVCLFILGAGNLLRAQSSGGSGHVLIFPEEKVVQLHDTFNIYVAIDTVPFVKSFIFDIEVDTLVIKLLSATREPFFSGPMGAFFFWKDTVLAFPGIGTKYVYETLSSLLGLEVNVTGPGNLIRLHLEAVGHGMSGVIFRSEELLDLHDAEIILRDSLNGLVVVCPTTAMFGDANFDGNVDISDAVYLIAYIFGGGPQPFPILSVGNADCSSGIDISDVVYVIAYIFGGGPVPCNPCT